MTALGHTIAEYFRGQIVGVRTWPFGCGLVELLGEEYLERVAVRHLMRDTRFVEKPRPDVGRIRAPCQRARL